MNKIYRLVWNSAQRAWVVAGEFAGAKGKGTSTLRVAKRMGGLSGAIAATLMSFPADAWVADSGTSSAALDNNNATNTSINGGAATATGNATAIGPTAAASGASATAIGQSSTASGVDSVAIGHAASATIVNSIAIGQGAKASGGNGAMALGSLSAASSDGAIAFGSNAVATGTNSTAIGRSAAANGYSAVSIGDLASTSVDHSTAIGGGSSVTGAEGTAIGWYANTAGAHSQALGYYSSAQGANATAVGPNATTVGDYTVALGSTASTTGNYGIAVGSAATSAANSLAMGMSAKATGTEAVAIGENAATAVARSIAIGTSAGTGGVATAGTVGGATTGNIAIGSTSGQNVKDDGVNMGGANTAIGTSAGNNVTGRGNQAIGKGTGNTVVGNDNFATGYNAGTNVTGSWNITQGINSGTNVTGNNNFAYGSAAGQSVTGADNIAIGQGAGSNITTSGTVAMGWHSNASQDSGVALGAGTSATTAGAVALGQSSVASRTGMNGTKELFSETTVASTKGAVSVGDVGSERQITNVAGGTQSTDAVNVRQLQAVSDSSVHYDNNPDGTVNYNNVTMGGTTYNSTTHTGGTKITNVADGSAPSDAVNFSQLTNTNNTINNIYATGTKYFHANSTGADSQALGADAIAVGVNAKADATSKNAIAMGNGASVTSSVKSIAIGNNAKASYSGPSSNPAQVVIGDSASVTGVSGIAIGGGVSTSGDSAIAIGPGAQALSTGAIAQGFRASATGTSSIAYGTGAVAAGNYSLALGSYANASTTNSVALGANSTTSAVALTNPVYVPKGANATDMKGAPTGEVSVGSAGSERRLTNLAAGAALTDAVNVSQLKSLADEAVQYDKNGDGTVNYNNMTLGGTTYNNSTHTGGTKITNVADGTAPSDAVNFSQLTETNNNVTNLGDQVDNIYATGTKYFHANSTGTDSSATGTDAVAIGMGAVADVARSVALGDGATTLAAIGTAGTTLLGVDYTFAGTAPVGTVSIGSKGSERTLTNVAAGSLSATSTDGVNGSQLFATNSAINSIDGQAVKYDTNIDGSVNYNSVTMGGDTYNTTTHTGGTKITNIADGTAPSDAVNFSQLTETNNNVTNLGDQVDNIYATGTKYFHANSTGTDSSATGTDAIAIGMGALADVARSVALGDGATTLAAIGTAGTTLLGVDYTFAGAAPVGTVSIGSKGEERTLTNVAAGSLSKTSTDGVNGSQLFATNSAINNLDDHAVKYDTNVDGSVNYNNVTMGGTTYNNTTHTGGTKITNVADGSAPSDAVNFSQLTNTNNTINNIYATGTKYFHANSTGTDSSATGTDAVAIGMGAVADVARSVALGDGATTLAAIGTAGTTLLGVDYTFAGTAPVGTVSIGSKGEERTLTNVAAGSLSATSTDGVNGSQLFATNTALNTMSSSVFNLDAGSVKYDTNVDGTVNYNNITLGGDTYDNSTHTGGTKITNVADGVDDSDAVNMSQLNETNSNVTTIGDIITNIAGDTSTSYTDVHGEGIRYVRTNEAGLVQSDSSAEGQGSTAVGYNATSKGESSLALGREAQAQNADDVALGSGSITDIAVGTSGARIADVDYQFAGINPLSTVSVGSVGRERTITNVAAGHLSATSTDAVNGSQLFATNSAISSIDKGSVKYDINDDGTTNYNSITLGGDTYNSTTKTGGTRIKNVAYGIDDGDAVNVQQLNDATTNIYTNGTKYFHANSEKADSVASGTDSVAVGPNAQSMGNSSIAMGDEAKSVGNGSMAMGAGAIANNANDIALGAGSVTTATVATTGTTIAGNNYAFAGTTPTSTLSIGSEGNERTITNVAAGRIAADSTDAVNGSELYATNQAVENISSSISNIDKGSVKYETNTDGSVNYNKVVMGGDTYDNSTHTGGTTITNVANGVDPSDAVNKYQLDEVNNSVTNISNGTDGMFQVNNTSNLPKPKPTGKDAIAGGAGAVASGDNSVAIGTNSRSTHNNSVALGNNSVTDRDNSVSVGYAGGERQVTNVAAGTQGTDAVNVSQLNQGLSNSNQYTNNKFNDLKNMVDDQKDKLSAGIAGAMAMATLPQPYQPGASMVGMAGGTYQGESAVALGVSTISDNGKWVTKMSGTTTSKGDLGAAVGVGYQW